MVSATEKQPLVAVAAGHTVTAQLLPLGVIEVLEGTLTENVPDPLKFPAIVVFTLNGDPFQK